MTALLRELKFELRPLPARESDHIAAWRTVDIPMAAAEPGIVDGRNSPSCCVLVKMVL